MADDRLKFHKLTPKGNVDLDVYNDAIDFAMRNSDLRNVAISGAYGSGKSSVLESYKNRHHEKKFIHISLSHFACGAEETLNDDVSLEEYEDSCNKKKAQSREIQLATLEGKILNQLIHQIPEEKIPQTRFKVKHNLSNVNQSSKCFEETSNGLHSVLSIKVFCACTDWGKNAVAGIVVE